MKEIKTRELRLVKGEGRQACQAHYRIVKLVNVLMIPNVGEVDVGMMLTRSDLNEAIKQGIKVIIYEARE